MAKLLEIVPFVFNKDNKKRKPWRRYCSGKRARIDLECRVCGRSLASQHSLEAHVNRHYGVKPHPCAQCALKFTTKGDLDRHVSYIHCKQRPLKCAHCDYGAIEKSKLNRHMRIHTGERPYQCIHCTYAAADLFKLKRHMRVHSGERPYACAACPARFTQANALTAHARMHASTATRNKISCESCPFRCSRDSFLRKHIARMHSAASGKQCPYCAKNCPDHYTYRMHAKTHQSKEYFLVKCKVCTFASTTSRGLKIHYVAKHKTKETLTQLQELQNRTMVNVCDICNRIYIYKACLLKHMATHCTADSAKDVVTASDDGKLSSKARRRRPVLDAKLTRSDVNTSKHNKNKK